MLNILYSYKMVSLYSSFEVRTRLNMSLYTNLNEIWQ